MRVEQAADRRAGRRCRRRPQDRRQVFGGGDPLQDASHALRVGSAHHQIGHRLGQSDHQERHEAQRQHSTQHENRAPAPLIDDLGRQDTAQSRAEREPAEHRRDEHRSVSSRRVLRAQRDGHRHGATQPDARQEAQRRQGGQRACEPAAQGRHTEEGDAGEHDRLSAVSVRERPEEQCSRHQTGQSRTEQHRQLPRGELPFGAECRCDEGNRSRVEAVDGDDAEAEQQHCHLHPRDLPGVDEALHIDLAMRSHG